MDVFAARGNAGTRERDHSKSFESKADEVDDYRREVNLSREMRPRKKEREREREREKASRARRLFSRLATWTTTNWY